MSNKIGSELTQEKPKVSFWYVYFFGITMKIGCLSITWHYGMTVGIYEDLIAFLVIASAYLMLALCMAEMVSIMSFSGGYYGYARCAMGPLIGYLVGCSGVWESMFYMSIYILKLGQTATYCFDVPEDQQPYVWIVVYVCLILFHLCSGQYFWKTTILLGITALLVIMIYLFGSMNQLNFHHYAFLDSNGFQKSNSYQEFLTVLRLSILFFIGFDMITLTSSDIIDSKRNIPRVLISLFITLFVLAIWIIFTAVSQEPGITKEFYQRATLFPLAFGYANILGITLKHATILIAILPIVSALGYLHIVSKQLKNMSMSGLLPSFLGITYGSEETPIIAMIIACCVALGANYFALREGVFTITSRVTTLAGCFVYLAMFYCFIVFRIRFGHLERKFINPLGIAGAIYGIIIVLTILTTVLYFKEKEYYPVTCLYFSYIITMLIYYYAWVENHQRFSVSEQKVFFKAYILNMQIRKKKAIHKRFASDITNVFHNFKFWKFFYQSTTNNTSSSSLTSKPQVSSSQMISDRSKGSDHKQYSIDHYMTTPVVAFNENDPLDQPIYTANNTSS